MGWASGSQLTEEIYKQIRPKLKVKDRKLVARLFYDEFCEHDADDWEYDTELWKDAQLKNGDDDAE